MDHWNETSTVSPTYFMATIRDTIFRTSLYIPIGFLVVTKYRNPALFKTYKYSIFYPAFAFPICWMPSQICDVVLFILSYWQFSSIPLYACAATRVIPAYSFGWTFDVLMLVVTFYRYLWIIHRIKCRRIIMVILFCLLAARGWIYSIHAYFFGEMSVSDACSPSLKSEILGGFMGYYVYLWCLNLTSTIINVILLAFLQKHFKNPDMRTTARRDDQKMIVRGLLVQGLLPTLTQGFNFIQPMLIANGIELSTVITNVIVVIARSETLYRPFLLFIFVRSFREEFYSILTKSKIVVIRVDSTVTAVTATK